MKVFLTGLLSNLAPSDIIELTGIKDIQQLKSAIFEIAPALKQMNIRFVVNGILVRGDVFLYEKDCIQLISLLEGG
jgi:hypothetical protein